MPTKPKAPKAKVIDLAALSPEEARTVTDYFAAHARIKAHKESQEAIGSRLVEILKKHKATIVDIDSTTALKLARRKSWEYSLHLQTVEADLEVLKKVERKEGLAASTLTEFPQVITLPTPDAPAKKPSLLKRLTSRKA